MVEEIFRAVDGSAASLTEKKFLRRMAVEAALAGGGRSHISLVQAVLAATGTTSVQGAKEALRSRGGTEEASRLGRLSKLRNAEAHLDCALPEAAAAVMAREESWSAPRSTSSCGFSRSGGESQRNLESKNEHQSPPPLGRF